MYRKIADLSPMNLQARNQLIELMLKSGQSSAAIAEYLNLAEMYYNLADLENARNTIQIAFRLAQESNASRQEKFDILNQLADIEMQSLNLRQAQRIFEEMRTFQPEHEPTRLSIVALFFRLGQAKQARNEIANYMNYLFERKQIDQAESFLEKLTGQYPQEPVLYQQQGELLRMTGHQEEAIQRYDSAVELYLQTGDKASAAEVVRSVLSLNPPNIARYEQLLAHLHA
jgi:tetratricopeptide (TPR) repeat protein